MTLVLPYGPDQIGNSSVYSGSARNSNMPCVFDGEALDFESALMTDWNSDINVYETSADDFPTRSPSGEYRLKLYPLIVLDDAFYKYSLFCCNMQFEFNNLSDV